MTRYGGAVAACGLAGGMDLPTAFTPFILGSISLLGIDSVMRPKADRELTWKHLENDWGKLADTTSDVFGEVIEAARKIVEGRVRGADRGQIRLKNVQDLSIKLGHACA